MTRNDANENSGSICRISIVTVVSFVLIIIGSAIAIRIITYCIHSHKHSACTRSQTVVYPPTPSAVGVLEQTCAASK